MSLCDRFDSDKKPCEDFPSQGLTSDELCNGDAPPPGKILAMGFDSLDFVQGLCCKITFSTIGTGHNRDVFDDEQILTFSIATRHISNARAFLSTEITDHDFLLLTIDSNDHQSRCDADFSDNISPIFFDGFTFNDIFPFGCFRIFLSLDNPASQDNAPTSKMDSSSSSISSSACSDLLLHSHLTQQPSYSPNPAGQLIQIGRAHV